VHVVADAAYHGKSLPDLPAGIFWTTRLPRNAVLYHRAPARSGKRGRPRTKGNRIGTPSEVAATCAWKKVSMTRYGRIETVSIAVLDCLWYGAFGPQPVRTVLVRDRETGPMLALITTDLSVVQQVGSCWSRSRSVAYCTSRTRDCGCARCADGASRGRRRSGRGAQTGSRCAASAAPSGPVPLENWVSG
jgi:hypothetical protein